MQRVIYVIPYTSIIEQNAAVFRDILGAANVLEHHCGVQLDLSDGAPPEEVRRALAAENWDIPVVVTTAVQLFESLYANRSSRCRKMCIRDRIWCRRSRKDYLHPWRGNFLWR